jgi:hypothetical protein
MAFSGILAIPGHVILLPKTMTRPLKRLKMMWSSAHGYGIDLADDGEGFKVE